MSMEEVKFVATFKKSKKIVPCMEFANIYDDVKNKFGNLPNFPSNINLKYEDKDVGEFVDLDSPIQLLSRKSNRLIVEDADEEEHSIASADTLPYAEDNMENDLEEENEDDVIESDSSSSSEDEDNDDRPLWPAVFLIKDEMLSMTVRTKLLNGNISETDRKILFTAVFDECIKFTFYPTSSQYKDMVEAMLAKFPKFRANHHTYNDAYMLLKHQLRTHFKNTRSRCTINHPSIIKNRQKYGKRKSENPENAESCEPVSAKKFCMAWGVKNFLPSIPEGECEETMLKHAERLRNQARYASEKQDKKLITKLMDITYPHRRKLLITDFSKITDVIALYPLLGSEEEIFKEFERLAGFKLIDRLKTNLQRYARSIISTKTSRDKGQGDRMRIAIQGARTDDIRNYYTNCAAILMLPYLLRENPSSYFYVCEGEIKQPQIKSSNLYLERMESIFNEDGHNFHVVVENKILNSSPDFFNAFAAMICIHYIFNLAYSSEISATMIFLQKYILSIMDDTTSPPKVISLAAKLKKSI